MKEELDEKKHPSPPHHTHRPTSAPKPKYKLSMSTVLSVQFFGKTKIVQVNTGVVFGGILAALYCASQRGGNGKKSTPKGKVNRRISSFVEQYYQFNEKDSMYKV
jgi:hypothetical protein